MKFQKGGIRPQYETKCLDCPAILLRASHWKHALCKECSAKKWRAVALARGMRQRQEARRYRILMAASPYDSFEELLRALKIRNPRTRWQRMDLTIERRHSA